MNDFVLGEDGMVEFVLLSRGRLGSAMKAGLVAQLSFVTIGFVDCLELY